MPTEDDFVQILLDDPEDYTTRLVFADWLEEHGHAARAEFLRVQAELGRWVPDLRRRTELLRRQRQLLADNHAEWLSPLRDHRAVWCREDWMVQVSLGFQPLESKSGLGDTDLALWLTSAPPARLWGLNLANSYLSDLGVRELCRSPLLEQLLHLDLRNNRISAAGVAEMLSCPRAARLKWIDFHGNDLDADALCAVAAWREQRHPDRRRFTNSLGMDFTLIPAGTFLMGSPESEPQRYDDEGPQHEVTLTRPFYLGVYAVTQRQYETVTGSNPSHFGPGNGGACNHPVEYVSWQEAVEFCRRLSALPEEVARGRTYRLPTEAEWEHACRGGGEPGEPFHFGGSLSSAQANFNSDRERTAPVGSFRANAFGLYDMHGNTWEWCADHYDERFYGRGPQRDPLARRRTGQRVCRGGSWHSPAHYCRSADRGSDSLDVHDSYYGFRVACDVSGGS